MFGLYIPKVLNRIQLETLYTWSVHRLVIHLHMTSKAVFMYVSYAPFLNVRVHKLSGLFLLHYATDSNETLHKAYILYHINLYAPATNVLFQTHLSELCPFILERKFGSENFSKTVL